jgi:hypothetical protein
MRDASADLQRADAITAADGSFEETSPCDFSRAYRLNETISS